MGPKLDSDADLPLTLLLELKQWYLSIGPDKASDRALTGVTAAGAQFVSDLSSLPIDDSSHLKLVGWICRREDVVAYAYTTALGVLADAGDFKVQAGIYSSGSGSHHAICLDYIEDEGGVGRFEPQELNTDLKKLTPFHDLQINPEQTSVQEAQLFEVLWTRLKDISMWRVRESAQR